MENLEIYEKYREVPKNALKAFDNGTFKGTDINTMWRIKCLTEHFGVCGIGWYYDIVRTWLEESDNTHEKLSHAEIKLYVKDPETGEWSKGIAGIGGNKMETYVKGKQGKDGYWKLNDECYKMAVTDAIGNACKNLGFGADVYWANDKTKYTAQDEQPKEEKEPLNEALVKELQELGGSLEVVADHYKVSVEELTDEALIMVIESKKRRLEKEKEEGGVKNE